MGTKNVLTRRHFVSRAWAAPAAAGVAGSVLASGPAHACSGRLIVQASLPTVASGADIVRHWSRVLTGAIAASATEATIASRAMSMVFEAIYNAWAAYQPVASFTLAGIARQQAVDDGAAASVVALSHAAHDVLCDLFADQSAAFDVALAQATRAFTAQRAHQEAIDMGRAVAKALLAARHHDGSNQLGDLAPGAYSDTSGYQPVNTADRLVDPSHWQPLRVHDLRGRIIVQEFLTPHWGRVRTNALASGSSLRPDMGELAPRDSEIEELLAMSASLDDIKKAWVEWWAANPTTSTPGGQWMHIVELATLHDAASLERTVKLFFAAAQALLDAGIACWDAKRFYDSARPISVIRRRFSERLITGWGGPGRGAVQQLGAEWVPYQRAVRPSPNFPEYPSGHSCFSHAAATVLIGLRGDKLPLAFTVAAGGVPFDPTVPAQPTVLRYESLSEAAAAAAWSRRLGGIHFARGDAHGRELGHRVGQVVLMRCRRLFTGQPV